MKITVLAAGAWGTALAIAFSRVPGHAVRLWAREADLCEAMQSRRENPRFLPGFAFPEALAIEADFSRAVAGAELLIVATPVAGLRTTFSALAATPPIPLLWVSKGFELGSGKLVHEIAADVLPDWVVGTLSGPSFAQEVAMQQPTAMTLATTSPTLTTHLLPELNAPALRIYASDDLIGVEVGGAVKNILAIAVGVCDGLKLGLNARAALITRGLAEIARLGVALGGKRETFMGLSGVGDLILTSTGDLSRNRQVGLMLAQGLSLPDILERLGHVAEGVPTTRATCQLARAKNIDMPIAEATLSILEGRVEAREVVPELLSRDPKPELDA